MHSPVSRRSALRTVAATSLAALAPVRLASAQGATKRLMTMDLVCGNLGVPARLPRAIELAAKYGFESVGADSRYLASLSPSQLDELLADMKAKHLVWGAAGLGTDFRGDNAAFRASREKLPDDARALQRAGVTRVGTWLSPSSGSHTYLANFRQHADRLREVARVLGDHGLRLGLEYVGPKTAWTSGKFAFVHTMAEDRELIAAIDQPNVGLVLDSWHWYCAGESPDDIKKLTNRDVVAVDLNDAPAGITVDHQRDDVRDLPCATGVIDVSGFLNALQAIGYDGPVRAEPFSAALRKLPPEEAVEKTAKAMKTAFALVEK